VPQDAKRNRADRGVSFHLIQQAGLPICNTNTIFAALDVFDRAAVADLVAQVSSKSPRKLVVATFDFGKRLGVVAIGVADKVERSIVFKAEQHVVDCVFRCTSLTQEVPHADLGEPRDLGWPVLPDAVADFAHDLAIVVFVKVGEADAALHGREIERHLRHVHRFSNRHPDSLASQQRDFSQITGEERLQFEPEVLHPLAGDIVRVGNAPGAGFGVEIVRKPLADGVYPTAGMELRLENNDFESSVLQFPTRRKPSQTRAQDHDTLGLSAWLR